MSLVLVFSSIPVPLRTKAAFQRGKLFPTIWFQPMSCLGSPEIAGQYHLLRKISLPWSQVLRLFVETWPKKSKLKSRMHLPSCHGPQHPPLSAMLIPPVNSSLQSRFPLSAQRKRRKRRQRCMLSFCLSLQQNERRLLTRCSRVMVGCPSPPSLSSEFSTRGKELLASGRLPDGRSQR